MLSRLQEIVRDFCQQQGCDMIEFNGEADHVHFLFAYYPQLTLSKFVNSLKTVTSRLIRKEFAEEVKKFYWKPVFWNGSYFIASCGEVTVETLKKYVQGQASIPTDHFQGFILTLTGFGVGLLAVEAKDKEIYMPTNTNILMFRHAEKPDSGQSLSELGQQRAEAYVSYFQNFKIDDTNIKLDYLFAAANSSESHRSKLTLEPLAKALGLDINDEYKDKDYRKLATEILQQSKYNQTNILICWHHQELLQLAEALGVNPSNLPAQSHWPSPPWPDDVFNWLLQLCYDASGDIIPFQTCCINECLLADDDNKNRPTE